MHAMLIRNEIDHHASTSPDAAARVSVVVPAATNIDTCSNTINAGNNGRSCNNSINDSCNKLVIHAPQLPIKPPHALSVEADHIHSTLKPPLVIIRDLESPTHAPARSDILHQDHHHHDLQPGTSTFLQATFNCVSLLLGLGILSSPYAVAQSGWAGVVVSNVIGGSYAYTTYLLIRCMEERSGCRTYQEVAKAAMGRRGATIVNFMFYLEIAGSLLGYCISIGDNLACIFPRSMWGLRSSPALHMSHRGLMMAVACLCVLPTVWLRDMRALSFTSMWSFGSTLLLLLAILLAATLNHIGFSQSSSLPFLHIQGLPIAAGLYAFCYGGTSVFPSIYKSMKDPTKFNQVLVLSFVIATGCVGGLGMAGAAMFGRGTRSQVTLSMPVHLLATKLVLWTTVLNPMFKFALVLSPVTAAVEAALRQRLGSIATRYPAAFLALDTLARSTILVTLAAIAMALPFFNYVVALIGSSVTIAICLSFPCVFYLRLCPASSRKPATLALVLALLLLSTLGGIYGSIVSFVGLIHSTQSHTSS